MPVEPSGKSPVRQRFTLEIYGKQGIATSAYWQQMTSAARPCRRRRNRPCDIVAFVRDTPGGIGYVWSGADLSGVKVVADGEVIRAPREGEHMLKNLTLR